MRRAVEAGLERRIERASVAEDEEESWVMV